MLEFTANFSLNLFERKTDLYIDGHAWRSYADGMRDFDFVFKSGKHALRAVGMVTDGMLAAEIHSGGDVQEYSFPIGDSVQLSFGMDAPNIDLLTLEEGGEVYIDTFDPVRMAKGKARVRREGQEEIEISGRSVEATVITTTVSNMSTKAWVNEDGEVLRAETPFGFMLEKITQTEAYAPLPVQQKADMIQGLLVEAKGEPLKEGAVELVVKLSGIEEAFYPPDGDFQQRTEDGYRIQQPELIAYSAVEEQDTHHLGSDVLIATEHPAIQEQAWAIVGDATDPWERSMKIYTWVYETIEKVPVISIPSALEVLRAKEGDCNEHTVLFVALARAVDVPAQVAIGLVWSDELGGFGYHAWPEVQMAEGWVPMDPTLGQVYADATHIKLLNGSIDQWPRLIPYLGQLEIEVVSIRMPEEGSS